jgi:uncharacterized membrane protein YphA (DoxX/SURF4 family)
VERAVSFARGPARLWRRFWFPAIPIERLGVFRILLCLYVLQDLLLESRWVLRYGEVAEEFYDPIFVIRALGLPRLAEQGSQAVYLVLVVACLLALLGLGTRIALLVAAPLHLYWFANYLSYNWVYHPKVATTLALFVLAVAPAGRAYSLDSLLRRRRGELRPPRERSEIAGWAVQVLIVFLALSYFFGGYTKLRVTGFDWWHAGAMEVGIADLGTPFARNLAEKQLWLVQGIALAGLIFELCAPLLLFRTRLQRWYAAGAIMLHVGTLVLLPSLNFLGWAVVATVVFELERVPVLLRDQIRSLPVLPDRLKPASPAAQARVR